MLSAVLRASTLLIELGVTAIGLTIAIGWLGATRTYWADFTRHGDYVAWILALNVILAFVLALRFESRRWIRRISLCVHVALVLLVVSSVLIIDLGIFHD